LLGIVSCALYSPRYCPPCTHAPCLPAPLPCAPSLKALADLFALDRIYNEIIFRNDDYIAPEKAKAIQRLIEALCSEVRGVAVPLVDAFAIPDHILRAPIGLSTTAVDPYSEYLAAVGFS
jgi:acyl-CoA oxidase